AVPQLRCIGGECHQQVSMVECRNTGFDGHDVQWECSTDLPRGYYFGSIDVNCEGYDYADDPYVLDASCGLEYTVSRNSSEDIYEGLFTVVVMLIWFGVPCVFCCRNLIMALRRRTRKTNKDPKRRPPEQRPSST